MGKATELVVVVTFGVVALGRQPVEAQAIEEPQPCTGAVRLGDANRCWAREAERADAEMRQAYLTAVEKLPPRAGASLKKAQKLWLDFRDAHTATLLVEEDAVTHGPEYPLCLSILRWRLARDRTAEIKRLLQPDEESLCPL